MPSLRKLQRQLRTLERYYNRYDRPGRITKSGRAWQRVAAEESNERLWRKAHHYRCVGFCDQRCTDRSAETRIGWQRCADHAGVVKRSVGLKCGHTFVESCPAGVGESSPRVCSYMNHEASDPGVEWMTDQGMAMSEVVSYTTIDPT